MTSLRLGSSASIIAAGAVLLAGCGAKDEHAKVPYPKPDVAKDGKAIAKIGDVTLTSAELEKRIQQQSPFLRVQLKDRDQKRKFVENEVRLELLAQEGWRREMYNDPKVVAELKRAIVQKIMRDEIQTLQSNVDVTDEELRDAYKKKESEYSKPEKIRISEILIHAGTPEAKAAAKKKLETIRAEIDRERKAKGELAFAEAARKYSEDEATKRGGGDLQFLTKEEVAQRYGEAVAAEMFDKTEVGGTVIADAKDGAALLSKTGKRRAVLRTLEMVKPQLRSQILGEKRMALFDGYVDALKKKLGVEIDLAVVDDLAVNINQPTEPPAPGAVTSEEAEDEK